MTTAPMANYQDLLDEFPHVCDLIKQASVAIRARHFSRYPLFVRCAHALSLGDALIQKGELQSKHYYYASYIEALSKDGLIEDETKFQSIYKDPDQYCMLLLIKTEDDLAQSTQQNPAHAYVSLPYPED